MVYVLFSSFSSFSTKRFRIQSPGPSSLRPQQIQNHDIVFLGTRQKQPPILEFISNLIPKLLESGVTHIGLEIASDQQEKIDRFMKTGKGLSDIEIHPRLIAANTEICSRCFGLLIRIKDQHRLPWIFRNQNTVKKSAVMNGWRNRSPAFSSRIPMQK